MLIDICNLWNETIIISGVLYLISLLFLFVTLFATKSKHVIFGAITALITGFFGQLSKIALVIGTILAVARLILIFI